MMYGYGNMVSPSNRLFSGGGANPLWNGLLAYYTADSTPNDALGTYNGTLVNGATYGTGIINQGFSLDGVNDYVSISNYNFSSSSQPLTFSAWINLSSIGANVWIIGYGNINIALRGGRLAIWVGVGTVYTANTILNTLNWYYITVVYKGSGTNNVDFYLNGVYDGTKTFVGTFSSSVSTMLFGASVLGPAFYGALDEIGIWDRELTPTEITELYNSGIAKQYPN